MWCAGRAGLTAGSTPSVSWDSQGRDDNAILKLQKPEETGYEEAASAAGVVWAERGKSGPFGMNVQSKQPWFSPTVVSEAGLDEAPLWKERSEELGSDPVTPRVLIPRGPRCHKVECHVMFDPAFAFAPKGDEAKTEGHRGEEGEKANRQHHS